MCVYYCYSYACIHRIYLDGYTAIYRETERHREHRDTERERKRERERGGEREGERGLYACLHVCLHACMHMQREMDGYPCIDYHVWPHTPICLPTHTIALKPRQSAAQTAVRTAPSYLPTRRSKAPNLSALRPRPAAAADRCR